MSVTTSTFYINSALGQIPTGGGMAVPTIGYGGAIDNAGTLSITDSTIGGNSATSLDLSALGPPTADFGYGGGINNSGTLSVTNSALSYNVASGVLGSFGGAIADSGTASFTYVTLSNNSAATGGGIAITSGARSTVSSIDSIYQNAQVGNISVAAGSFQSQGHNLFSDDPAITLGPSDLVNTDPMLGSARQHGGPSPAIDLLPGSPAINAGIGIAGITTDQRGAPRPGSGPTDIGSFEVQPPLTVTSLQKLGTGHQPTTLLLSFNLPLDASRPNPSPTTVWSIPGKTRA